MDSPNLPFIPSSVAEQWMLAQDAEEINLALEEIIDQYKGNYSVDNSGITSKKLLTLIKQIIVKINLPDDAVRLNCLRLLRLLAEDHAIVFEEVAFMVYSKIQIMLQDHSRMIRTCALSLAAAISSRIPLYGIADNILTLVEERPSYRELSMKVASVAVLGLVKQCNGSKSSISESHRRLLRAYIIRLASCASLELLTCAENVNNGTDNTTGIGSGGSEDSKAIHHAAMDLLATSSLAIEELDNLIEQSLNTRAQSQQLALRNLLSSIAAHQAVAVLEFDIGTEREICRRMKNLDFPSLAEESTYSSIKPLLQHIIVRLNSINEKKLTLDQMSLVDNNSTTATKTSPRRENCITTTHNDTAISPRNSTMRRTTSKRAVPNIRKSWSNSSDLLPPDWEAPDTAPAGSLQFSPPKIGAAASPAAQYMRSSSQKGDAMLGEVDTSSEYAPSWSIQREASHRSGEKLGHGGIDRVALLDRRAARPSRKFLQSDIEDENSLESSSRPSPVGSGSALSSFYSCSMASHSESNNSVHSHSVVTSTSASVSNSFRDPTLASGRSSASSQDADEANEALKAEGREFMGRSLRLLKSPHQRGRSDGASAEPYSPVKNDSRVFFSEDESPCQTLMSPRHMRSESGPDWLPSSSTENYTQIARTRKEVGGTVTSESDAASTSRPLPNSQTFDSASKARLKRSRLKSANAAMNRVEESASVDSIAGEQNDSFFSPHRGTKPPVGHTALASKSDIGLTRHLSQDQEDRYLQNLNHSSEDIFPRSEDEGAVRTPARRATGGRRARQIHSPVQSQGAESSSLDLTEVTSLITKPDTTFDYVPSEELSPIPDPHRELTKAYRGLEIQEWPEIFHTLTTYRRLALHHPAVITSAGTLHNTVQLIMKRVDELRSSLAKNAMLTIEDFIKGLGKSMDIEIAAVMPKILKRSTDSSSFLVESADNVLQAIIDYASLGRTLPALLTHIAHRSPGIRAKVAVCLHALIHSKGEEIGCAKDFDGMKAALPKLLQDSAPEARAYSRETVRLLVQRRVSTKVDLESHISIDLLEKVLHEHTGRVYAHTVCSHTIAAPGSADYSLTSSSPMRVSGRRTGRSVSSARSSVGSSSGICSGGVPFSPATDRSLDSAGCGWSGAESGLETPSKPERAPRVSRARQDITPSRAILNNHNKMQRDGTEADTHDDYRSSGRLRASSEHLSAQLDAHLSSPLPARATTSIQKKATASGQSCTSSSSMSTAGASSTAASLATAAAAKRAIEQDPELCNLQEILGSTTVSSWTARKDALDSVTELVIKNYDVLRDANKLSACVDCLLARLEDGSVKVHMHAISCLERVNEEEPLVLQHNLLQIVVPAVLGSAASTNKLISGKSVQLLRLLFDTTSPIQVAQYLCHTALHEKEKLRLTSLRFLSDVMPVFCADLDSIVSISKKVIFPALRKILFTSSTKGDQRVCATDCVRSLQSCLRAEKVWLWAEDLTQQEELKRITATV